jgi:hypothetical protein
VWCPLTKLVLLIQVHLDEDIRDQVDRMLAGLEENEKVCLPLIATLAGLVA